jgi:hypothetical protein
VVRSQPRQIVHKTLSQRKLSHTHTKKTTGRVAQGAGPEIKLKYRKKKREEKSLSVV